MNWPEVGDDPYDVVDIGEVQAMVGLSRPRVDTLTRHRNFPPPVIAKRRYRLWHRRHVEAYFDRTRPGWRERAAGRRGE